MVLVLEVGLRTVVVVGVFVANMRVDVLLEVGALRLSFALVSVVIVLLGWTHFDYLTVVLLSLIVICVVVVEGWLVVFGWVL